MEEDINILNYITIDHQQAEDIVLLLNGNEWNRPDKPYDAAELLREPDGFFLAYDKEKIVGLARLRKVHWYQWEFFNLVIDEKYRAQGIAKQIANNIEYYVAEHKGGILQATTDPKNVAIRNLLLKLGWKKTIDFVHPFYKKPTEVWQKSIGLSE